MSIRIIINTKFNNLSSYFRHAQLKLANVKISKLANTKISEISEN